MVKKNYEKRVLILVSVIIVVKVSGTSVVSGFRYRISIVRLHTSGFIH